MSATPVLRVLDRTTGLTGAYAALLLHQAGADVVGAVPHVADPALAPRSALATYLRQGQRAVPFSATGPGGPEADVVLASPGCAEEREALTAARRGDAGLIVVAVTPYGLSGPDADRPATDLTLQADSGALAIRGRAGEEPFQMGGRTVDWLAGAYAAAVALILWRGRCAGGPGALVDLSLAEVSNTAACNFMDVFHAVEAGPDAEPARPPRQLETPSIERTADGWVGFNTNAPHQATAFLRMLGRDDLADSGEWMMAADRLARLGEWQAMVTAWTSTRTTDEVIAAAVAHHVPVAPVCDGRTVAELDHVRARRALVPAPGGGSVQPGRPWRIDGDRGPAPEAPPGPPDPAAPLAWRQAQRDLPAPEPATDVGRPLAGLRVLDLTAWWAGPSATALLAALGAEVVHVEGPARMDGVRMVGAAIPGRSDWWELSCFFLAVNSNKRDVVVDLASARGQALALALAAEVDVVVENFTPHVLDRVGLGWEAIHAANPRTVLVRMPAFGLDGPWRDRPGFAQNIEQASGLAWLTGGADDQPRIQRGPSDPNGGLHAVIGLMAALDRRDRSGEGSLVEVSLFEAALALAAESITTWSSEGALLTRDGNRSPLAAPQGVYRTGDDDDAWLALSVVTDAHWRALAAVIDRPDLADDPALAGADGRRAAHDRLDEVVAAWVAAHGASAGEAALVAAGVPAAVARDPRLTVRHPSFAARRYHEVIDHPVAGPVPVPTLPFRVEGVEHWVDSPAPCFGQHNDEVLSGWLGLSSTDIAALRTEGVLADRPIGV